MEVIQDVVSAASKPPEDCTYVAGPMTGYPAWNEPAFKERAAELRRLGMKVISPNELHAPSDDVPWDWYLRRDIVALVTCTRMVFLPGWERSKGARLEHAVGEALGLEMVYPFEYQGWLVNQMEIQRQRQIAAFGIDPKLADEKGFAAGAPDAYFETEPKPVEPALEWINNRAKMYVVTEFVHELDALAAVSEGTRLHQLGGCAFKVARFVRDGHLPYRLAYDQLATTARDIGLGEEEVEATLRSAFKDLDGHS